MIEVSFGTFVVFGIIWAIQAAAKVGELRIVVDLEPHGITGSSVMPHFGQVPGPIWRTSGCIGQVYTVPGAGALSGEA